MFTHQRMYTSFKCLIWGEDLVSDPVGFILSVALKRISHGSLVLDVQVWTGGRGSSQGCGYRMGCIGHGVSIIYALRAMNDLASPPPRW